MSVEAAALANLEPSGETEADIISRQTEPSDNNKPTENVNPPADDKLKADVKPPVDERGVPLTNKIAELERKLAKSIERIEAQDNFIAAIKTSTLPAQDPAKSEPNAEDMQLLATNPTEWVRKTEERITNAVRTDLNQRDSLKQINKDFPMINKQSKNYDSEFADEVAADWQQRTQRYGKPNDLSLLYDSAKAVKLRRLEERLAKDEAKKIAAPLGNGSRQDAPKVVMTDELRAIQQGLRLSEDDFMSIYKGAQ